MGRKKNEYSRQELLWACDYIDRKFKLDPYWPQEDFAWNSEARAAFDKFRGDKNKTRATLQAWCEIWLDEEQRVQLESAVRARRKRYRNRSHAPKKTITLDHEAWLYLSELAKRDKVTISRFLVERLEGEYMVG